MQPRIRCSCQRQDYNVPTKHWNNSFAKCAQLAKKKWGRLRAILSQAFPVIAQYSCCDCNNKASFITLYSIIFQARLLNLSSTHYFHVVYACTWGLVDIIGVLVAMGKFYTNSWDGKMAFALPGRNQKIPHVQSCTLSRNVYMQKREVVDANYKETGVINMV